MHTTPLTVRKLKLKKPATTDTIDMDWGDAIERDNAEAHEQAMWDRMQGMSKRDAANYLMQNAHKF
jgi:hypothetical protein